MHFGPGHTLDHKTQTPPWIFGDAGIGNRTIQTRVSGLNPFLHHLAARIVTHQESISKEIAWPQAMDRKMGLAIALQHALDPSTPRTLKIEVRPRNIASKKSDATTLLFNKSTLGRRNLGCSHRKNGLQRSRNQDRRKGRQAFDERIRIDQNPISTARTGLAIYQKRLRGQTIASTGHLNVKRMRLTRGQTLVCSPMPAGLIRNRLGLENRRFRNALAHGKIKNHMPIVEALGGVMGQGHLGAISTTPIFIDRVLHFANGNHRSATADGETQKHPKNAPNPVKTVSTHLDPPDCIASMRAQAA